MQIILFCNQAGQSAGQPGKSTNVLNFSLPPKSDRVDDDNAAIFTDANGNKGAHLTLNGVSDEALAEFKGNPRVLVTIQVVKE